MGIITRMLRQSAVYWPPTTASGEYKHDEFGKRNWDTPVQINVRWEDVSEEFVDDKGEVKTSRAKVYVSQDVEPGGILLLGDLDSSVVQSTPLSNTGAWEIRSFSKVPNLRATEYVRIALL